MALGLDRSDLEAVLLPLATARPLPSGAYVDGPVFDFDRTAIFESSWHPVAREEELALPGQWIRAPLSPAGIVVTRADDLELRAFQNTCLHRAMPLVAEDRGRQPEFVCPYHAWAYGTDGRLLRAPGRSACPPGSSLFPVRVETWRGFVFVNLDPDARSLHAVLGSLPPWLAEAPLEALRRVHRSTHEAACNWKLLVANFQESHHFPSVHPSLERLTPTSRATTWTSDGPWLGGVMELAPEARTVAVEPAGNGRVSLVGGDAIRKVHDAMRFPNWLTSLQPDYFLSYLLVPLAPQRTRIVADIFVHAGSVRPAFDVGDLSAFWERVNAEDRAICEAQQRGMSSGYRPTAYADLEEDGVHAFESRIARAYLTASP